ncbi:amidohydrolase [Xylona heveae TC161]|uniref:Amidohydrolase n=1 Tax=Xylona heveae (strain CBS 132557 / TC161) TaxID=1328760 RepID=A0A165H6R3_XYLHT|nr:amidohydrolase [Xylona heveae TC161]KZF23063.1 amidohydrolase [Xylona heveae TC161]
MAGKNGILAEPPPYEQSEHAPRWCRPGRRRIARALLTLAVLIAVLQLGSVFSINNLPVTTTEQDAFVKGLDQCRLSQNRGAPINVASASRDNPRWNAAVGQQTTVVIKNASLFDGETTLSDAFDITFESGVIHSVSKSSSNADLPKQARVINAHGRFVTPGLVDIHSHHLLIPFPELPATRDVNERPLLGPITPFVRALDGFKAYDPAIKIIASGGITSSLVLPGSANIVGGEAFLVKNLPLAGKDGEPVAAELLLEDGVPEENRQRYLKMACGENPKGIYGYTRLGLTWLLREHLDEARKLQERQNSWCEAAVNAATSTFGKSQRLPTFLRDQGFFPSSLKYETTLALLRGELNVNIHCYEPQDFEDVLNVLHEFGVHPQAFHHALEAWQVPEFLKHAEENITIATFADNGFFKAEAYGSNLRAPKILNDHGIPVALKSDHTGEGNYAKYLADQAAVSHSFGLPTDNALQSITSIPARSLNQAHRIGFVRPGYDADLVIWDDHPLQVGATPSHVFVDGRAVVDDKPKSNAAAAQKGKPQQAPAIRPSISLEQRESICDRVQGGKSKVLFTGIKKALVDTPAHLTETAEELALVVKDGQITCFDTTPVCVGTQNIGDDTTHIKLQNGYLTPGLIAFGNTLGIQSIPSESSTGDGSVGRSGDPLDEQKRLHFAKYGVHLHDRALVRSSVGGVTKAVSAPLFGGSIVQGVSVGLRTSENVTLLDGGIWQDEVALHLVIGQKSKGNDDTPTVSAGIERLRQILEGGEGTSTGSHSSIYARAANGSIPVVIQAFNEDDIAQIILIKRDFPTANLVLFGGHGAPLVAKPLADAGIPVIFTGNRGAPDTWEKRHLLTGPPLTESPAKILTDAGVSFALAITGDSKVYSLAQEAQWAAKYAGLTEKQAISLVSTNIETILGLRPKTSLSEQGLLPHGDVVVWEGNPLKGEGSVVVSIQEDGRIGDCWPEGRVAAI